MARIAPLPRKEWRRRCGRPRGDDPTGAAAPPATDGGPTGATALLDTFAHHTELAKAFFTYNGHLLWATSLTRASARSSCGSR